MLTPVGGEVAEDMPDTPVTTGELSRRFDRLESRIDQQLTAISQTNERQFAAMTHSIERMSFVPREVFDATFLALRAEVAVLRDDLEEQRSANKRWAGALVAGLLSLTGALIVLLVTNLAR